MLEKLPGWVVDDVTSVRQEVAEWVDLTPAERWKLAQACARDVIWAVRASGDAERILSHIDPLPVTSVRALERLRRKAGWGDDGR
ncbi:MAG: hypothetical protein H6719_19265 [Sandaracinaceae bacterium]|nr:hypothetical protein [Sandaracinaceae bacterium]